ncbi:MAG: flagellar hook-associated protein FlgL, partial [Acidimicrobiales bacterium]
MIGRISAQSTTAQFQRLNAAAEAKVNKFNQQISSGLLFENPSESPADTSLLLGNSRRLARIQQYSRNATSANQWLASTDQALQSANDSMTRARTLVVQGLNTGAGTDAAAAAAAEIRQIRDQLIGTANTTQGGRAIFSGTASAPAYDAAGTYLGDDGAVTRAIDTYEILQVNATGPNVFGTSNPTDPMNGSIFEQLGAIADALESGDTATASQGLDAIDSSMQLVRTELGKIGASVNRLDSAQIRLDDEQVATRNRISQTQDADLAEAV